MMRECMIDAAQQVDQAPPLVAFCASSPERLTSSTHLDRLSAHPTNSLHHHKFENSQITP